MEVVNENVAYLSNFEVLEVLRGIKANKEQKSRSQLATITYETVRCLEESTCKTQTPEKIQEFMKALKSFKLTKCEKLALLNLCPKTPLEMQLIIEDSEERLNESEVENLLQLVATHLGEPENQDEGMEEAS
ncbi:DNA-directed RNA polymerase III subunit RPC9 [Microplitis mediator]|uniref:DNA-directed RNA polymerase III subunit RPC9 n=1 Tax=Microplitis mediator TaxID=375433 RepID=UPI002555355C|nr:DNA-directed RNA polymerase III subunit RPC9 [Microplitis mediator]